MSWTLSLVPACSGTFSGLTKSDVRPLTCNRHHGTGILNQWRNAEICSLNVLLLLRATSWRRRAAARELLSMSGVYLLPAYSVTSPSFSQRT